MAAAEFKTTFEVTQLGVEGTLSKYTMPAFLLVTAPLGAIETTRGIAWPLLRT